MSTTSKTDFDWRGAASPERFLAINQERLRRVYDSLTGRQRDFLDALPVMFHTNHAALPGFIGRDAPFGIAKYAPSQATLKATRRLARTFESERRMAARFAIRGIYMMGSPGTIAYSRRSDLDMWVMHDPELSSSEIEKLKGKAALIEKFADTLGLEVHFFVFDADSFRQGQDMSLSDESSGSSQHYLLLDEFYRSSLLVAGLPPLWWLVPSKYDHHYDDYVAAAEQRGLIDRWDAIDFGGLPTIPADEFFGAAVWHLYKSIHSPYKSVLKLLLMEAYADEYPDITLLSTRYKQNIESGEVDLNALDPYILMYEKVGEYLRLANDPVRLEVLRRSFYLKANLALSDRKRVNNDWRATALRSMVASWGWAEAQVERLDQRENWGLDIAVDERRDLTRTFKASYAKLSRFAKDHASDSKISKQDLHVLGRKLYVAFEKKPSKLEIVTRGICPNPVEQRLSLHEVKIETGKYVWLLFAGTVTPSEISQRTPIKRSGSAAEIVLWSHLNNLADNGTTWHVFTTHSELSAADVKRINDTLEQSLVRPDPRSEKSRDTDRRRIARLVLLINVGVNPFARSHHGGDVLTTNAGDPLAYGGSGMNLVRTVDLLFMTSWDEAFAFRYEGPKAILEAVAECLQWAAGEKAHVPPGIETRCFSVDCATQIESRVDTMFKETVAFMTAAGPGSTPAYVMQSEETLHLLKLVQRQPKLESYANQVGLFRGLGEPGNERDMQLLHVDRGSVRAGSLPVIYGANKAGVIQVFARQRGKQADVYVIDERGYLVYNRQECFTMSSLLQHYQRFLDSALPRCFSTQASPSIHVETYEISQTDDELEFELELKETEAKVGDDYLSLHVLADADSSGHQQFTIYTTEREFSTWEHGGSLFAQVAEFVLAQRGTKESYPIYITDLDLSTRFRQLVGVKALQPFDLLNYKKRIEFQLTRAMQSESSPAEPSLRMVS